MNIYIYKTISIYICCRFKKKTKNGSPPFIVCSSCKRKFVISLLVYEETKENYPFANELNRLNGLAHLHIGIYVPSTPLLRHQY